jgi:hypothetical protein
LFKKGKDASGKTQNNIGDNNTNIQGETVNVNLPAPKEPEPYPLFGSVPRLKTEKYIWRGDIEADVRAALRLVEMTRKSALV